MAAPSADIATAVPKRPCSVCGAGIAVCASDAALVVAVAGVGSATETAEPWPFVPVLSTPINSLRPSLVNATDDPK
jgi:hypothetical protein